MRRPRCRSRAPRQRQQQQQEQQGSQSPRVYRHLPAQQYQLMRPGRPAERGVQKFTEQGTR
jgi:hypothetical protein